ncbi:MAG TPA: cytochrome c biogenesis protein ResB [Terriglobales bacterium]|nr:cytochrome c biogenesis protein ResB [Terriglobales bacterium]
MVADMLSIPKQIYKTLSNLRTGIVLLLLVVIASALGTFILQRPTTDLQKMQAAYSPQTLRLLDRLTLTDIFHAWWFLSLLGLLSLSIVLVSIDRFPNSWRFYARPYRRTDSHFRAALPTKVELPVKDGAEAINAAQRALKKLRWPVERITDSGQTSLYAERHRFSVMAVYVIHASLLLIFAGGIIDGLFGYSGFLMLQPGQTGNVIATRTGENKALPFSIKCYAAGQENYADGSPRKWWSKLAVVQDGKEVQSKEIVVNDPLVYRGLRFYQASFGPTGKVDGLQVMATASGGAARELTLRMDTPAQLDPDTTVTLSQFIPDFFIRDNQVFKRSDDMVNPAFRLEVKKAGSGEAATQWLFPAYDKMSQGKDAGYHFEYREMKMGYFTGLEVSHEPGQWLVWAGCLLMGAGLFVAFYMVHMRLWIVAVPDSTGRLVLWIGGQSNKNKDRFQQKFDDVVEGIRAELGRALIAPRSAQQKEESAELTLVSAK